MEKAAEAINRIVWGFPALILILSTGIWYSLRTRFLQVRKLPLALGTVRRKLRESPGDGVSPFQAVCTALAATVGTGNIAGVAGAISLGGPGALFWMWMAGILGMIVKYAEVVLALRYRKGQTGNYRGGPMYYIESVLGRRTAMFYCGFGLLAASGVGNSTQISTAVTGIREALDAFHVAVPGWTDLAIGILLGALLALVLVGGAKRIGSVSELLIPLVSLGYIVLSIGCILNHRDALPGAFRGIILGAFCPKAFTGGAIGSAFLALRVGVARGVFTNEAGMGTASIAHAGASTQVPAEQGLFGFFEVFADTLVICSMTGLVILTAPFSIEYGRPAAAELTLRAFACTYGSLSTLFLSFATALFAFATVLGWGLYGMRFAEYLFGKGAIPLFRVLHAGLAVLGAVVSPTLLWTLAETTNGLMALPNLTALLMLTPQVLEETKAYFRSENG